MDTQRPTLRVYAPAEVEFGKRPTETAGLRESLESHPGELDYMLRAIKEARIEWDRAVSDGRVQRNVEDLDLFIARWTTDEAINGYWS